MTDDSRPGPIGPNQITWRAVNGDSSSRRLFGCNCCRRIWELLPEDSKRAVESRERLERGQGTEVECCEAIELARSVRRAARAQVEGVADEYAADAAQAWAAGAAYNACTGNWPAAAELAARAFACVNGGYDAGYSKERLAQWNMFVASVADQEVQ